MGYRRRGVCSIVCGYRIRDRRRSCRSGARRRLLQLLPGTQGIYGLLIAVVIASNAGLMNAGGAASLTLEEGLRYLFAGLPIAFGGLLSAIYQGKVACSGINLIAKKPAESGKGMLMAIMVETYAVLALLVSFLLLIGIR